MRFSSIILIVIFFNISCSKKVENSPLLNLNQLEIKGTDLSNLPEVRQSGVSCYNDQNQIEDMLLTLKKAGVNTIRLRIWESPNTPNSNFNSVKNLSNEIKSMGLKVMITIHYSDSWADPAKQTKPEKWRGVSFNQLKDSVYNYTQRIVREIDPEYVQIGNEINNGFLWPEGSITNFQQMKELLQKGISAVRETNKKTKIILHYAGFENANAFYSKNSDLDYDIIGLSYYPMWHGKSLPDLKKSLITISNTQNKSIFIAETSYPFTLGWNDWTNNILGLNSQLLMPYEASPKGQKDYLSSIINLVKEVPKGIGFCYWGAELISYNGAKSTNGSTYENQAFWDFNNKSLPVLECYKQ
jgi:arabinogalactan endo-1,4-beta-galactosidase